MAIIIAPIHGILKLPSSPPYTDTYLSNQGGTVSLSNFDGNGTQTISAPGAGSGATYQVSNNTTVNFNIFRLNAANVIVDSGSAINTRGDFTNANGGHLTVNGTFTVGDDANLDTASIVVNSGGTFTVSDVTNLDSAYIQINGGTVNLQGNLAGNNGAVIDFNNAANGTLVVGGPNELDDAEALTIKNFSLGSQIQIADVSGATGPLTTTLQGDDLIVTDSTGKTIAIFTSFTTTGGTMPVASISGGTLTISSVVCFLRGTRIRVSSGETAVEDMRVGDKVVTIENGMEVVQDVVWVGTQTVDLRTHAAPELARPVRICRDALADGMPYKDLLVTPEHCLFMDGKLIPARMLVNGRSIISDESFTKFDIFHIETASHSILVADGVLTESYLDTGNRRNFRPVGKDAVVITLSAPARSWEHDAAAPLTVAREIVEPVFRQFEERAISMGLARRGAVTELTTDAGLHLVADNGRIIQQVSDADGLALFMIPPYVTSVRIVSRTSKPSEVVGPFLDDRRDLGVSIGEITLFEGDGRRQIDTHLTIRALPGWDILEASPQRWTNGNAFLPLGERLPPATTLLGLKILGAGPYRVRLDAPGTARRKAG